MSVPEAAFIEIVEKTNSVDPKVIVPNEIRINGVPLLAPDDEEITIHEMGISSNDVVKVTLTLFARRVSIHAETKGRPAHV